MPAITFFALLREGRRQERMKYNTMMGDMVDIALVANTSSKEYVEALKSYFKGHLRTDEKQSVTTPNLKKTSKEDQHIFSRVIGEFAKKKVALEGGGEMQQ